MSWKEFGKEIDKQSIEKFGNKASEAADKGLNILDNVSSIFSTIKWILIFVMFLVVVWIGNGIKNALVGSQEAVTEAVTEAKQTVIDTKDAAVEGIKAGLESDTATQIKNGASELIEDVTNSEEYEATKEKVGEVITDKIGSFFKKKDEVKTSFPGVSEEGCTLVGNMIKCSKEDKE